MKTGIVSSADIAAEPGAPLNAEYWLERLPGETWPVFKRRRKIEELERRARRLETSARKLRRQARALREEGMRAPL